MTVPATFPRPSRIRRVLSIARAEILLFVRNPTILATALLLAPATVAVFTPLFGRSLDGASFVTVITQVLATWALLLVVYYNLTVIFVTRREEGVFQRMSTGEASPWEALIGASIPSAIVAYLQVGIGLVVLMIVGSFTALTNVLLIVLAVTGAIVILTAFAAWSSTWTATVEGAQYSTMPGLMLLMASSGTVIPLSILPDNVAAMVEWTPMYAMSDLLGIAIAGVSLNGGYAGLTFLSSWEASAQPVGVLALWSVLLSVLARHTMRFAKRR
ncbi:ABC transporter permease [Arcanobacterium haemolyticum]|nr:ABC transporter permease [Arcanobacterium haemolyticum]